MACISLHPLRSLLGHLKLHGEVQEIKERALERCASLHGLPGSPGQFDIYASDKPAVQPRSASQGKGGDPAEDQSGPLRYVLPEHVLLPVHEDIPPVGVSDRAAQQIRDLHSQPDTSSGIDHEHTFDGTAMEVDDYEDEEEDVSEDVLHALRDFLGERYV